MAFKSPLPELFPSGGINTAAGVQDDGASVMPRIMQALSRAAAEKKRLILLLGREAPHTSSYWVRNFMRLCGRGVAEDGAVDKAGSADAAQLANLLEREYVLEMMNTGAPMGTAVAISTVDGKHAERPRLLVMNARGQVLASIDLQQRQDTTSGAKAIGDALIPAKMDAAEAAIQKQQQQHQQQQHQQQQQQQQPPS
jgi:hypothetical protein